MAVSLLPTRPTTRKGRQEEKAKHFLAGTSRSAHRLEPVLEESFSSTDLSLSQHSGSESDEDEVGTRHANQLERRAHCKKGCPAILGELSKTYESVGTHTGKTAQYRKSNYPNPKKGKIPRNVGGENISYTECPVVLLVLSAFSPEPVDQGMPAGCTRKLPVLLQVHSGIYQYWITTTRAPAANKTGTCSVYHTKEDQERSL